MVSRQTKGWMAEAMRVGAGKGTSLRTQRSAPMPVPTCATHSVSGESKAHDASRCANRFDGRAAVGEGEGCCNEEEDGHEKEDGEETDEDDEEGGGGGGEETDDDDEEGGGGGGGGERGR